jgi:uncharacterized membrane protein YgcG
VVIVKIKRILKHLLVTDGQVNRAFPPSALRAIEEVITASEAEHTGEIRFVVEGGLDGIPLFKGQSARERAIELFSRLRMWDTQDNSGLLIYLLLADRAVEIVADRGISAKVSPHEWGGICREMESAFKKSSYATGVVGGVQAVTHHLVTHFPADGSSGNELPDKSVLM